MGKLFGTDGIRGVVGENLTAEQAFRVGQAVSAVLAEETGRRPVIMIGKDTRISSATPAMRSRWEPSRRLPSLT